jgi:predicted aconitase with swiveling domain
VGDVVGRIGGIAAGWTFHDLKTKSIAPKALVFGVTNPVMVQGAVFAGITITERWLRNPFEVVRTGDAVRVDPSNKRIEILRHG